MNKVYILNMKNFLEENSKVSKEEFLNKHIFTVSMQRQDKVKAFYFIDDKIRSLSAYLLLSKALKEDYMIDNLQEFKVTSSGKPYLKNNKNIFFNISHCKNFVACIIGNDDVGIDIQDPFSFDRDIAKQICSKEELKTLNNINETHNKRQLNRIWVLKEAYTKFTGQGLLADLKSIDFSTKEKQKRQDATLTFIEDELYNLGICIRGIKKVAIKINLTPELFEKLDSGTEVLLD